MRSLKPIALMLVCLGLVGCGASHNPEAVTHNDPRCSTVTTDIESVWSDEIALGIEANVTAGEESEVGSASASGTWSRASYNRIRTGMDQSSQDWARIRSQNCNDVEGGRLSTETYEARMGCLDQWLANARSAVQSADESRFETVITTLNECFTASRQ